MKRLLIITYYFPPVINPSVQRPYFYAKLLPKHGWEVTVVTKKVEENWPIDPEHDPREMDVHHIATWEWPFFWKWIHKLRLWWLFRHVAYYLCAGFVYPAARKANELMREKHYDAVLVSSPADVFCLIPSFLNKQENTEIVMDFRDPPYGYESRIWQNPLHQFTNYLITRNLVKQGYKINNNSDDNEEHLLKLFPELKGRTGSIVNGFSKESRTPPPDSDKFIFSYTGTLMRAVPSQGWLSTIHSKLLKLGSYCEEENNTEGRSLIFITAAFEKIKEQRKDIFDKLFFDLAGEVSEHDWNSLKNLLGENRVRFQKNITLSESQKVLKGSHVLFLPQWEIAYCRVVLGKLYEYLGLHRPILACVSPGQMRKMLTPYSYAVSARPTDIGEIVEAIIDLHDNYSQHIKEALVSDVSQYSREHQVKRMAEFLNS